MRKSYSIRNLSLKTRFHLKKYDDGMALIMVHFGVRWGHIPDFNELTPSEVEDYVKNPRVENHFKKKYSPIKFSTQINIHNGAWDQKNQKAINNYDFINKRLDNIREIGQAIFNKLSNNGSEILISPDDFKAEWRKLYQPNKKSINTDVSGPSFEELEARVKMDKPFTIFCQDLIESKKKAKAIKNGTARSYMVFVRKFEKFQSEEIHREIQLGSLNNNIINQFLGWLNNQKKVKKQQSGDIDGFRTSYLSKQRDLLKRFILFLKNEEELDIPVNTSKSIFKKKTEKTADVALNKEQIKEMYLHQFSEDEEGLERTRDLFIIGCFSGGLRISDLNRLNTMSLKKEGEVSYHIVKAMHKKTRNVVELPVHPYVRQIFQKYGNSFPKISDKDFNKNIKIVGMRLGWNQMVELHISDVSKSEPVVIYKSFYSLLKSSTCRRTFCTMLFKDGWSLDDICAFSGHDNVSSLLYYIKFQQINENVLKLHQKWSREEW